MAKTLWPVAQRGVGIRVAHDPGDPLITSHCPFCGSGQVVGRSDGTIECDFCGQNYIVRVQPAFPGMPQAPGGPGAPSDIGPDGGVLPPDAIGPDGLPMDGAEMPPGEAEMDEDEGAPPFGDDGDEDGGGPPDSSDDDRGEGGPPPEDQSDSGPPKSKGKSKKAVRTYLGLDGATVMTEEQYARHLAANLSAYSPPVMALLRLEASRGRTAGFLREDNEVNRGHYERGWRASSRAGDLTLGNADLRGEHGAWYDGYLDYAVGRPKWHSLTCGAPDHERGDCTLAGKDAQ